MKEVWIEISKNRNYEVSNLGRVRRSKDGPHTFVGRIIKTFTRWDDYICVQLSEHSIAKIYAVHKLVAEAFIGPCPAEKEVNHEDGDKSNNKLTNLSYTTKAENIKHAYRLGLRTSCGSSNGNAKLTNKKVLELRELYKSGKYTKAELARKYRMLRTTIGDVLNRRSWKIAEARHGG